MKKIYGALLGLVLSGVLVSNVSAATLSIGSDTASKGATNKSVNVELKDTDLSEFVRVEFQLDVTGTTHASIDYSAKTSGISFGTKTESGNTVYILGTQDMNSGSKSKLFPAVVGSITYSTTDELSSDFKITPTNVKFYKEDGSVATVGTNNVKIVEGNIRYQRPKSSDASLTSLSTSQGELMPAFNKDITDYKVQVKDTISTIRISAAAAQGATRTGTGSKTLVRGENLFEIEVTAEDGVTKQTYTINVICGEIAEPSAFIKTLEINNIGVKLSPEFDSKNNKYTVTIAKDIKELDFKYELEDPLANVVIEGNEDLDKSDDAKITITVVSSDGVEEQVYELKVEHEDEKEKEVPVEKEVEKKKKNNSWLLILIGFIIALIVGGVAFLLFRKKPSDKNKGNGGNTKTNSSELENNEETIELHRPNREEVEVDERTQTFDPEDIKAIKERYGYDSNEEDDKTKEYDFKDLR